MFKTDLLFNISALWKHACDEQMDLKIPKRQKGALFVRKSSLYDETPLIGKVH